MGVKIVRFSEEARIELHKAKCFMEFLEKEDAFWKDIDKQLDLVLQFPYGFQVRYREIRIVSLDQFNYSIHYIPKPDGVLAYRFLNKNQDF